MHGISIKQNEYHVNFYQNTLFYLIADALYF